MALYFGDYGFVEIERGSVSPSATSLDPADVNTAKKRFSVDFVSGSILTGDQIVIATKDKSTLGLVSGHNYPDGRWYVHVDDAGGLRLYETFKSSLSGLSADALGLVTPSSAKDITIQSQGTRFRPLGSIRSYELTTSRENVDTSVLGDQFRNKFEKGLISGQGSLDCLWEHRLTNDSDSMAKTSGIEFPIYLSQLCVRLEQGADFKGRFFLFKDSSQVSTSVWYEADCSITNVGVTVPASGIIETKIEFITSGVVSLNTGEPPAYLLQENSDKILQEGLDPDGILLEDPTS